MKRSASKPPFSDIGNRMQEIVRELNACSEPMPVTQKIEAAQAMIGTQCDASFEETLALLKLLALGAGQSNVGLFRSADAVFADLHALDS